MPSWRKSHGSAQPFRRSVDGSVSTLAASAQQAARNAQICIISYRDRLVFGISTAFLRSDIEEHFFRSLVGMGIDIELETTSCNAGADKLPARSPRAQRLRKTDAVL